MNSIIMILLKRLKDYTFDTGRDYENTVIPKQPENESHPRL